MEFKESGAGFDPGKLRQQLIRRMVKWRRLVRQDQADDYFFGWEKMPPFGGLSDLRSVEDAWWLAELCRLAYTPDAKEKDRSRFAGLPDRASILAERTRFVEVANVHKTGNHASWYRWESEDGGRKASVLCFRGSKRTRQWVMNAIFRPHRWERFRQEFEVEGARVHSGFYVFFKRIWPLLDLGEDVLPRPWIMTGHSLGGALATIAALVGKADSLITFGSPKVGGALFSQLVEEKVSAVRWIYGDDIVPLLPIATADRGEKSFVHGGDPVFLDRDGNLSAQRQENGSKQGSVSEQTLLFQSIQSLGDVSQPPSWVLDHRMGGYCRGLRKAVAGAK